MTVARAQSYCFDDECQLRKDKCIKIADAAAVALPGSNPDMVEF
jgi:hypothetical protein